MVLVSTTRAHRIRDTVCGMGYRAINEMSSWLQVKLNNCHQLRQITSYPMSPKKQDTLIVRRLSSKRATKWSLKTPSHLRCAVTLGCKLTCHKNKWQAETNVSFNNKFNLNLPQFAMYWLIYVKSEYA